MGVACPCIYAGADPDIQELKRGGAEGKYLQCEDFALRHSHFGEIWL